MTPESVAAVSAIVGIVERIGLMPIGVVFLLVQASPLVVCLAIMHGQAKQNQTRMDEDRKRFDDQITCTRDLAGQAEKRFDGVVQMYENNACLVRNYEKLAEDQRELLTINIESLTKVKEAIATNMFCPVIRDWRTFAVQRREFCPEKGE
jgi:hypothetical protein